ncbi:MAG: hypothetical protein MJ239_06155 [Bacilli bacterium]|nr:hypothetical protein [Bacilli bacterium]
MKKYSLIQSSIMASFLLIASSCGNNHAPVENKDFQTIRTNYMSYMLEHQGTSTYGGKTIDEIMSTVGEKIIGGETTYFFNDIDYSNDQDRSSWPAGSHLGRTLELTVLAEKRNNHELKNIALNCLKHWIYSNYRNTNWWQNEIGANQNLSNIAMFSFDSLTRKGQDALLGKLYESSIYHRPSLETHEGSNLLNYCEMTVKCGALDKSYPEIDTAIKCASDTIKEGGKEGYQRDGSFFQHGKLLQTGSYGIEGTTKLANVISMLKGTSISVPLDKLGIISNFILNGLRPMIHKGMYNYMATGRAYSRVNSLDVELNAYKVSDMKKYTELENMPNKDEINSFIDDVCNKTDSQHKKDISAYEDSKILVGNYDGVYMCYKGSDPSMTNTECVNHENCLGYNFSYGQNTCVMQSGKEYLNISPLWDYTATPGSTSRDFGNGTLLEKDSEIDSYVKNSLDNGLYEAKLPEVNPNTSQKCIYNLGKQDNVGFSMTQSVHDITSNNPIGGVEFTSTCFMCDEGMIVLGSGLKNKQPGLDESEKVLHTSLEQCRLYDGEEEPFISEDKLKVTKNNVVYCSLDNQPLSLDVENRQYDYQRNNPSLASKIESGKVMTITLNSAKELDYDHYAYSIQPLANNQTSDIKVICNTPKVAAIQLTDGRIVASFYSNDSFTYLGKEYKPSAFDNNKGCFEVFN